MGKNPLYLKAEGKKQAHVTLDKWILAAVTVPTAGAQPAKGALKKSKHGGSFDQHSTLPRHSIVSDEQ